MKNKGKAVREKPEQIAIDKLKNLPKPWVWEKLSEQAYLTRSCGCDYYIDLYLSIGHDQNVLKYVGIIDDGQHEKMFKDKNLNKVLEFLYTSALGLAIKRGHVISKAYDESVSAYEFFDNLI